MHSRFLTITNLDLFSHHGILCKAAASCSYPKKAAYPLYAGSCGQQQLRELPCLVVSTLCTGDIFSKTGHEPYAIYCRNREQMHYHEHANRDVLRSILHLTIWGSLDAGMEA